ncbi:hypothetical protein JTB14_025457 [Gonioctena quinquepunctata]|nr:hypothetical protein JTB14_025457 [Gonioctena quinquepunctata]
MTVISKQLFDEKLGSLKGDVNCDIFHIWEPNCFKAHITPYWMTSLIVGAGKFFLPIYLIKLLMDYKKKEKKTLFLNFLKSQIRSMAYGWLLATLIVSSICLLRKLLGRFNYYSLLFVPGFIAGTSIMAETRENQVLDGLIFFNSFIETILNFIGLNRKEYSEIHILLVPYAADERERCENKETCSHEKPCTVYFYRGFSKYFALGYAVNIIRRLIPKMGILVKKPSNIFNILISKSNFYFGLFIGSYVGLYRVLTCYMTTSSKIEEKYFGSVAGLFCGLTYAISPNIQVLVIAITTLLQMIYHNICEHFQITNHFWQRQLIFMWCNGFLLHHRFYNPKACSPYYSKMIDGATNNVAVEIYDRLIRRFFL